MYLNVLFTRREVFSVQTQSMDVGQFIFPIKGSQVDKTSLRRHGAQLLFHLLGCELLPGNLVMKSERVQNYHS